MSNTLLDITPSYLDYSTEGFRLLVENHLSALRHSDNIERIQAVDSVISCQCAGDFYAVLAHYKIPHQYQWVIMRVNGYLSPFEYTEDQLIIFIPKDEVIENLMNIYRETLTMEK